jgi:NTP pyrophosphatase (non-canonical NTP hydrolase)
LVGEAGELANKIKKVIRDNNSELSDELKQKLRKELGMCFGT